MGEGGEPRSTLRGGSRPGPTGGGGGDRSRGLCKTAPFQATRGWWGQWGVGAADRPARRGRPLPSAPSRRWAIPSSPRPPPPLLPLPSAFSRGQVPAWIAAAAPRPTTQVGDRPSAGASQTNTPLDRERMCVDQRRSCGQHNHSCMIDPGVIITQMVMIAVVHSAIADVRPRTAIDRRSSCDLRVPWTRSRNLGACPASYACSL